MSLIIKQPDNHPCSLPSPYPGPDAVHLLPHSLNKEKQTRSLLANTTRPDVQFEVSPSKQNLNVHCSPGFYQQIAKPALANLSNQKMKSDKKKNLLILGFMVLNTTGLSPQFQRNDHF